MPHPEGLDLSTRITGTDLDHWSGRQATRGELPAVVRQLIMATVHPTRIRFPADEAVSRPGLDGVVTVAGGAGPHVPGGDSVWEASTNGNPKAKATEDYKKRTEQTGAEERAGLTFVFVTSRSWRGAEEWIEDIKKLGDGWKDIRVIEAEGLALWLNTCPGVEAWLASHLNRPYNIVSLQRWFTNWSVYTEPDTPADVPLAGRRGDAIKLLNDLDGPPSALELCAGSIEEVVAFVAATLLLSPGPDPKKEDGETVTGPDREEVDSAADLEDFSVQLTRPREPDELEAILARTVVVETPEAWSRWCHHDRPQVLIPLFYPNNVAEAVAAGHHVVLPRVARDANDKGRLSSLSVDGARAAWTAAGVDLRFADDYARASRRNLQSLRRRIARHPRHRTPEWASGPSAPLLATTLLAGSWDTNSEGDVEVLLALTERATLRTLNRELGALTLGDDPPLSERGKMWRFIDVVDAWDAVVGHLSAEDLELFIEQVMPVLTEADPALRLTGMDRLAHSMNPDRPRRRYSGALRDGMATTLAVLGSLVGDTCIAGDLTGSNIASIVVRDLLDGADADLWLTLSGLLPLLAEAAPDRFLDAVEKSLRDDTPAVMALFTETHDGFGGQRSHHSPLLWALETLAFAPTRVARVAVLLAKLTELDPGGRLSNRPSESLTSLLHLRIPQGAVDASNRLAIIDTVRRTSPAGAPSMLAKLMKGINRGMLIRTGPRYRNWPTPRTRSKHTEIVEAIDAVTDRLLRDTETTAAGWPLVADLIGYLTPQGRTKAVEAITRNWDTISADVQAQISKTITSVADRHRQFPDSVWAMSADEVAELDAFLAIHGAVVDQRSSLFSWMPKGFDPTDEGGEEELQSKQVEAVREVLNDGLDSVIKLAQAVDRPYSVGCALGHATADYDDGVLDLLDSDDPATRQLAAGLVTIRSQTAGWLEEIVGRRPHQAARLLLALQATNERLDLLAGIAGDQRDLYWKQADAVRVADDAVERYAEGLLGVNRLFTAIDAVSLRPKEVRTEVVLAVLSAPNTRESADTIDALQSPEYEVGRLLALLEDAGTPSRDLAQLEWYYLPLLTEERLPRALHQRLATEPEFFAEVVSHMYQPDPPSDEDVAADEVPEDAHQVSDACWRLSRDWREPLPGAVYGSTPDAEAMHEWVKQVREELAKRNRAGIASLAIGEALAGRTTDEDGTWPCLAVRTVLEREQDDDLEDQLAITRLNQRGATVRGMYEGGKQEWKLAAKYRKAADELRDEWPRTGKVLDRIIASYEADARREDGSAEP